MLMLKEDILTVLHLLLVYEQEAIQNECLSSRHSTASGDYKRNIQENTISVCKRSKYWEMTN